MKTLLLLCAFWVVTEFGMWCAPLWADGSLQTTIAWKNVDSSRKIQLEKGQSSTGPWALLAQLEAGTTSYVDATNAPGEKACYRMTYLNVTIPGPYSAPKCKTFTATATGPPSTVTVK